MESRHAKSSDPDIIQLAVAKLGCSEAIKDDRLKSSRPQDGISEPERTRSTPFAGIDAADLLGHFYSPAERLADPTETVGDYPDIAASPAAPASGGASLAEAAEILGLDRRTVLGLIRIGELATEPDGHGRLLISNESLQAVMHTTNIKRSGSGQTTAQESAAEELSFTPSEEARTGKTFDEESNAGKESHVPVDITTSPARVDIHELVSKLTEAQFQLESASYRVGFLEAELASSEQKIKLLPDILAHESRLATLESENLELRLRLDKLERRPLPLWSRLLTFFQGRAIQRQPARPPRSESPSEPKQSYPRRTRQEFF